MLLTLCAQSLASLLAPSKKGRLPSKDAPSPPSLALTDLPRFTRDQLGLFGLNFSTSLLAGADVKKLDAIREAADRASCPCLVLLESDPQPLATLDEAKGFAAVERMIRVVQAASRLGCNSVAMRILPDDQPDAFDYTAERVRMILAKADKLEVNVLIAPWPTDKTTQAAGEDSPASLTTEPEPLTELIKKIGGFRIGTYPDFQAASLAKDPLLYLRRLVPYAQAVSASVLNFSITKSKGRDDISHEPYDLVAFAKTVESVGYTGTLGIDFRGAGDPLEQIAAARSLLESALGLRDDIDLPPDDELLLPDETPDEDPGEDD